MQHVVDRRDHRGRQDSIAAQSSKNNRIKAVDHATIVVALVSTADFGDLLIVIAILLSLAFSDKIGAWTRMLDSPVRGQGFE